MPTSGRGRSKRAIRLAQGFTLIEILLVVMIIGIGASLIVPGLSATRVSAKDEAARIAALIDHAQTLASLRGVPLGWQSDAGGYGFLDWRGSWKQTTMDHSLRRRELSPGLTLDLATPLRTTKFSATGKPPGQANASTAYSASSAEVASVSPPHLVFPPSGFMRPFTLTVTSSEGAWNVVGDAAGRVSLVAAVP